MRVNKLRPFLTLMPCHFSPALQNCTIDGKTKNLWYCSSLSVIRVFCWFLSIKLSLLQIFGLLFFSQQRFSVAKTHWGKCLSDRSTEMDGLLSAVLGSQRSQWTGFNLVCDMKACSSANTLGRLSVTVGSDLAAAGNYLSKMSVLHATMLLACLGKSSKC